MAAGLPAGGGVMNGVAVGFGEGEGDGVCDGSGEGDNVAVAVGKGASGRTVVAGGAGLAHPTNPTTTRMIHNCLVNGSPCEQIQYPDTSF